MSTTQALPDGVAAQIAETAGTAGAGPVAEIGQAARQATQMAAEQASSAPVFSWSSYLMAIGMLCLILAVLWLLLRWLKKSGGLRMFGISAGTVIESRIALGPKKNLLVVNIEGKRLLLGVTDHHISRLAELPSTDDDEAAGADESSNSAGLGKALSALRRRGGKTADVKKATEKNH